MRWVLCCSLDVFCPSLIAALRTESRVENYKKERSLCWESKNISDHVAMPLCKTDACRTEIVCTIFTWAELHSRLKFRRYSLERGFQTESPRFFHCLEGKSKRFKGGTIKAWLRLDHFWFFSQWMSESCVINTRKDEFFTQIGWFMETNETPARTLSPHKSLIGQVAEPRSKNSAWLMFMSFTPAFQS